MILGAGWPMFLGGITPYLDRVGASERVNGRKFLPGAAPRLSATRRSPPPATWHAGPFSRGAVGGLRTGWSRNGRPLRPASLSQPP